MDSVDAPLEAIMWIVIFVDEIESSCVQKCFNKIGFNVKSKDKGRFDREVTYPSNEDLIQKLPDFMQCNASDYEVVDNDLCIEEASNHIIAFMPQDLEDVLTQVEELSDDSDKIENLATHVINFATALDSVHNLTLSVNELGDTNSLQHLHQLRMHYGIQLFKRKVIKIKLVMFLEFFNGTKYVHYFAF